MGRIDVFRKSVLEIGIATETHKRRRERNRLSTWSAESNRREDYRSSNTHCCNPTQARWNSCQTVLDRRIDAPPLDSACPRLSRRSVVCCNSEGWRVLRCRRCWIAGRRLCTERRPNIRDSFWLTVVYRKPPFPRYLPYTSSRNPLCAWWNRPSRELWIGVWMPVR